MVEGFIPDEMVDRVRSGNDIVELISEYVSLKRTGANYLGLCPFHSEKTPSFTVSPAKQIFHCFGCGAGGDVVGFLIRHENYTFPEALKRLADRAGIILPEPKARAGRGSGDYEIILKANEEAMGFFSQCLWDGRDGEKARRYLDGRGMPAELSREFGLGYSPNAWDGLLKHLEKKGIKQEAAVKAGLAVPRTSGQGHYDRFRDRLMFPIRDVRGRVIGFGGRTMGDDEPKYLNSPETALFKKGETLYGLEVASAHVRKQDYAIIVEGYFDAIACHRAGVKNAVATLGTALTQAHLRLIGRFSKNVLLVFDSDEAGQKAAERSLEVFLGTDMTAKVALLPEGDDPDSLVKRGGAEALRERLRSTVALMDFVIKRAASGAKDIDGKAAAAARITGLLARVDNGVVRSHYLKRAADELGVDEQALMEELNKKLGRTGVFRGTEKKAFSGLDRIEGTLLHLMLHHPDVAGEVRSELSPEDFSDPRLEAVVAKVFELMDEGGKVNFNRLMDTLTDEKDKAFALSLSFGEEMDDVEGFARGAIKRLSEASRERKIKELQGVIKQAEDNKDLELLNKSLKELVEWQKKKR